MFLYYIYNIYNVYVCKTAAYICIYIYVCIYIYIYIYIYNYLFNVGDGESGGHRSEKKKAVGV
jgi:hypothetical protein